MLVIDKDKEVHLSLDEWLRIYLGWSKWKEFEEKFNAKISYNSTDNFTCIVTFKNYKDMAFFMLHC